MKKSLVIMGAASVLFFAGCCTTPRVTKWEYKQIGGAQSDDALNKLANDGWTVVAFSISDQRQMYILKRAQH